METLAQKVARLSGNNPNVMVVTIAAPATPDYSKMSLSQLATCIGADWRKTSAKGVHPYAKPYLEAMACLNDIKDNYGADTGYSVVAYLLGNLSQYKGETAKAIKAELKKRLKRA
jgi:hypothetical protein